MIVRKLLGGILVCGGLSVFGWGCSSSNHSDLPDYDLDSLNFALLNYDHPWHVTKDSLLIYVENNNLNGLLNLSGKEIVPCRYNNLNRLENYQKGDKFVYRAFSNGCILIDTLGKEYVFQDIDDLPDRKLLVKTETQCGILGRDGEMKPLSFNFDRAYFWGVSDSYYIVETDGKKGLLDKRTCEVTVPCIYDEIVYCDEFPVPVRLGDKWGTIDKKGKTLIPIEYNYIIQRESDLVRKYNVAACSKDFSYGYSDYVLIDSLGKELSSTYRKMEYIRSGHYLASNKNGFYPDTVDVICANGKVILRDVAIDRICTKQVRCTDQDDLLLFEEPNATVCFDSEGNKIFEYDGTDVKMIYDGFYWAQRNDMLCMRSFDGKEITSCYHPSNRIIDSEFDNCEKNDRFLSTKKGKWGLVNRLGKDCVTCNYDSIVVKESYALVVNEKKGLIDMDGNVLVPTSYDEIIDGSFCKIRDDQNKLSKIVVSLNGKMGVYDILNSKEIIKCKYDKIQMVESCCIVCNDGRWGTISWKGTEILPCIYDDISFYSSGYGRTKVGYAELDGKKGLVGLDGKLKTAVIFDDLLLESKMTPIFTRGTINDKHGKLCFFMDSDGNCGKEFAKFLKKRLEGIEVNVKNK